MFIITATLDIDDLVMAMQAYAKAKGVSIVEVQESVKNYFKKFIWFYEINFAHVFWMGIDTGSKDFRVAEKIINEAVTEVKAVTQVYKENT